jgi:hypothetical protein
MGPELIESTGDHRCDKIVQGLIGIFGLTFPDRVRGYYLRGSRTGGSSIAGSDLDLSVVFRDQFVDREEYDRARELADHCAQLSPVLLEVVLVGERILHQDLGFGTAMNLKLATRLLYGDDIRSELPDYDADRYRRSVVHTPFNSYRVGRPGTGPLAYPLQHLDPGGPFLGFDQWATPDEHGIERPSTKLLVAAVGWTATGIIALNGGDYVRDKAACAELYRRQVADEWTDLVVRTHDLCRNRWHYRIPDDDHDRRALRGLCERALPFQNHFLVLYRDAQRAELDSGDPERRALAERGLAQVTFPD